MRFIVSFICLGLCLGIAHGETCTVNGDCVATTCNAGNTVICQHPAGSGIVAGGGLCTCKDSAGGCVLASDCYGSNANLNCPDNARHCYDSVCICDRFPIGKRSIE